MANPSLNDKVNLCRLKNLSVLLDVELIGTMNVKDFLAEIKPGFILVGHNTFKRGDILNLKIVDQFLLTLIIILIEE